MVWTVRVENSEADNQKLKVPRKKNLNHLRMKPQCTKELPDGPSIRRLMVNQLQLFLLRKKKLRIKKPLVLDLLELKRAKLTLEIQTGRHPKILKAFNSLIMVGFVASVKTTTSLVVLTVIGVRSAKMLKIVKENLVIYWFLDSIKPEQRMRTLLLKNLSNLYHHRLIRNRLKIQNQVVQTVVLTSSRTIFLALKPVVSLSSQLPQPLYHRWQPMLLLVHFFYQAILTKRTRILTWKRQLRPYLRKSKT